MEREIWRWMTWALKRLPRRWQRSTVYDNREVLAVLLWAALHDRSILWATKRCNWPPQAWRRRLPTQSTMSRRLRDQRTLDDLHRLLSVLRPHPVAGTLIVDGKPLAVSKYTHDPEARCGWGAGRYALGYKLHVLIDTAQQLLAWDVQPMNEAESVVARHLLAQAAQHQAIAANAVLLGDAAYDSNPLHATAQQLGVQLIAPRRKPNRSISSTHRQHPSRLLSIKLTEHDHARAKQLKDQRIVVERFLGTLATVGGGLIALPAWARRLARVRVWVGAKLAIHAARSALKQAPRQTLAA